MATPRDNYDTPWKDALSRYFPDFMAFYFPLAHAEIDWSRPHRFLEPELAQLSGDGQLGRRLADKLVEVALHDGTPRWVLVHIEVQGQRDGGFAERMFTYNYRVFDSRHRPVASLALLADDGPGWKPCSFHYSLFGCKVGIEFPVVKLLDFADRVDQLLDDPNPFALVTAAYLAARQTKGDAARRAAEKWRLAMVPFERNWDERDIIKLLAVIDWMLHLPERLERRFWRGIVKMKERSSTMAYMLSLERLAMERGLKDGVKRGLKDGVRRGLKQGRLEGRQEGLQEGLRRGQAKVLKQLLRRRFGSLPPEVERRVAQGTEEQLLAWSESFVDAATLDQVFRPGE